MQRKHKRVFDAIFEVPTRANIKWNDVESLLLYLGAEMYEREGSRVIFVLNGVRAVFHRPHPEKEVNKSTVRDLQVFLVEAGVKDS